MKHIPLSPVVAGNCALCVSATLFTWLLGVRAFRMAVLFYTIGNNSILFSSRPLNSKEIMLYEVWTIYTFYKIHVHLTDQGPYYYFNQ